jgi:hypothetical protein
MRISELAAERCELGVRDWTPEGVTEENLRRGGLYIRTSDEGPSP